MNKTKNSKNLICVCHYPGKSSYTEIKELSQTNIDRLKEAKQKRERIGGSNRHFQQVQQIPESFDLEKHGVHSRPCYNL